ncbi:MULTISPECIES: RNA recognition motif domain-containing protein [Pseudoalteromonas]|uniref:RNA-binding protein n=2 Tax=Pseudoalteromonas TaxID=53246 RepID=A0A4Q7E1Y7_9GAMM|nr:MULTISPECIES: RNA-binding protein [Pseudoalteromonas]QTL36831.1 RNA-binding protein [Pseudoalteromonas viridis]RZM75524.1 RNA-binding protein [Pseudoalteromonas rubra]
MNILDRKTLFTVLLLAILSYALGHFVLVNSQIDPALLLALGIVIGGVASAFASSTGNTGSDNSTSVETTTLYVGNLPYRANEQVVRDLFEKKGRVFSVRLLKDKNTGKRRGFGFVEMPEPDALKAINELNESEFQQRTLKVREAKQKQESLTTNDQD